MPLAEPSTDHDVLGDIILHHPEANSQIAARCVALEMGYEAGIRSTITWRSSTPPDSGFRLSRDLRPVLLLQAHDNALANLREAADSGVRQ